MSLSFTGKVLVIGDIMLDRYTETQVSRISPEAPVPVATVKRRWEAPGGAANVAQNLVCLGVEPILCGVYAKDEAGLTLQRLLKKRGVTVRNITGQNRSTTCKTRILAMGQQLLRLDEEESQPFALPVQKDLWQAIVKELPHVSVVVLSDYAKGIFNSTDKEPLAQKIIQWCNKHALPVIVDPKGINWERYTAADCLTPNTKELEAVLQTNADHFDAFCTEACQMMQALLLPRILLTRSEKGMALINCDGSVTEIPAQAREVSDVSGAGDTVIAVMAACLTKSMDWLSAACVANVAAGVVVSKIGASPIHLDELNTALAERHNPLAERTLSGGKIYTEERLVELVTRWKNSGESVVFTNGCFDILHIGHLQLIREAARQGQHLIVAINSDASVKRLKGAKRPIQNQENRAALMAALLGVDAVIIFEEDTPLHLIETLNPDVLVKGGDYTVQSIVGSEHVLANGGRVFIVDLLAGHSTTRLIDRMADNKN